MRQMRDSGVPWIGEIPSFWGLTAIKHLFYIQAGGDAKTRYYSEERDKKHPYPVYTNSIDENQIYAYTSKPFYSENTITVTGRGSVGVAFYRQTPYDAIIRLLSCKPIHKNLIAPKFYVYWINGTHVSTEQTTVITQLSAVQFGAMPAPFLPLSEQKSIASFLDAKCAEINSLSTNIQQQIDLLERYKRSVITEAVTKGLNPDVPMKDSGIPWCPRIPVHWTPINPKALFSLRNQRAKLGERQLTASQKYGIVYQDEFMERESQRLVTVAKDFSILKQVEPDDFVISMRSFQGGLEYSTLRGSISSAYVMLIPNKKKVYPPFYRYFFKSDKYINALQSTSNLVRDGQAMRYSNFVQVRLFDIPMEEQKAIAAYLDNKCPKIDALIAGKKAQLASLAALKKSVIFDYVTGKKEVPAV